MEGFAHSTEYNQAIPEERQQILENVYDGMTAVLQHHLPHLDPAQTAAFLRDMDFSGVETFELFLWGEILPYLSSTILPPEADVPGSPLNAFQNDLALAETSAGGNRLIADEGEPVSEEFLRCQAAGLRATVLFARNVCGYDCDALLKNRLFYCLAEVIIRTGHNLPAAIRKKLSCDDLEQLVLVSELADRSENLRKQERDNLIENTVSQMDLPPALSLDGSKTIARIRSIIADSIWKAWHEKENMIRNNKNYRYQAVKRFFAKYPDFSCLISWLAGDRN